MTTTIFKCIRGSRATGLSLPNSDHDYFKVIIPPPTALIGLSPVKGSQKIDPVTGDDCRVITLTELVRQAIQGKSVEVEWLFVDDSDVLEIHPIYGQELMNIKQQLVSARMLKGLLGFATGNRTAAINGNRGRFRKDIGYDPKAMSHALRALWQAIQLKSTGTLRISPGGTFQVHIMSVKKGETSLDTALSYFEDWDENFNLMSEKYLPKEPDFAFLEKWVMKVHSRILQEFSEIS